MKVVVDEASGYRHVPHQKYEVRSLKRKHRAAEFADDVDEVRNDDR
jgi:hypothetical protein